MQYYSCLYVLLLSFGLSITKENRCVSIVTTYLTYLVLYIVCIATYSAE